MDEGIGVWCVTDDGVRQLALGPLPTGLDLAQLVWDTPALVTDGLEWKDDPARDLPPSVRLGSVDGTRCLVAVEPRVTPTTVFTVLATAREVLGAPGGRRSSGSVRIVTGEVLPEVVVGLAYLEPSVTVQRLATVTVAGERFLAKVPLGDPVPVPDATADPGDDGIPAPKAEQEPAGPAEAIEGEPVGEVAGPAEVVFGDLHPFLSRLGGQDLRMTARRMKVPMTYGLFTALARGGLIRTDALAQASPQEVATALEGPGLQLQLDEVLNGVALALDQQPEAPTTPDAEPGPPAAPSEAELALQGWLQDLPAGDRDAFLGDLQNRYLGDGEAARPMTVSGRMAAERVQQELHRWASGHAGEPVRAEVTALRKRLGPWIPLVRLSSHQRTPSSLALLSEAGYVISEQRVGPVLTLGVSALPPVGHLPRLRASGLVLNERSVWSMLEAAGLQHDLVECYLENLGFEQVEGHWVGHSDSDVERAVARLAVHGGPMSPMALSRAIGVTDPRELASQLLADPRVRRMGTRDLALRAWVEGEGEWITGLIKRELARRGGSGPHDEVVDAVAARHTVKREKVAAYALAPMFVRRHGTLRARGPKERWVFPHYTAADASVSRGPRGVLVWTVPVNAELLRGGHKQVPMAAAKVLELQPGTTMAFTGTGNLARLTLTTTWRWSSHTGARLEHLGAVARSLGAQDGDSVEITVSPRRSSFSARLVRE